MRSLSPKISAKYAVGSARHLIVAILNKILFQYASNFASKPDRYIHIVGTKGEIEGKIEENTFVLRVYDRNRIKNEGEEIDVSKEVVNNAQYGGHSGGDHAIMRDLVEFYNGNETSVSMTKLAYSVNGRLCVYAAEKSRRERVVVNLNR